MENTLVIRPWQFLLMNKAYVDKVNAGMKVIVSGRHTTYRVEKEKDPYKMTGEELDEIIEQGMQEYREGKTISFSSSEEMHAWLDSL